MGRRAAPPIFFEADVDGVVFDDEDESEEAAVNLISGTVVGPDSVDSDIVVNTRSNRAFCLVIDDARCFNTVI